MSDSTPPAETTSPPGPQRPPDSRRTSYLGLSRGDATFSLIVGAVILVLTLVHWVRLTRRGEPAVEIDRLPARAYEFQIDINHATWVEWMQLPEIGEMLARRIVEDVEQRGPFSSIDDVTRVKGVGPKTLEQIRPFLYCSDCDLPSETPP
jgi:competence protein ComEA